MAGPGDFAYQPPGQANAYGPPAPEDDPETYAHVYKQMSDGGSPVPQSDLNAMAIEDGMRRKRR